MRPRLAFLLGLLLLTAVGLALALFLSDRPRDSPGGITWSRTDRATDDQPLSASPSRTVLPLAVDADGAGSQKEAEAPVSPGRLVVRLVRDFSGDGVRLGAVRCERSDEATGSFLSGGNDRRFTYVGEALESSRESAADELSWDALQPGTWQVIALKDSTLVPSDDLLWPVVVRSGETTTVSMNLVPGGVIRCRVELPGGEPVAAADVRLVGPLGPQFDFRHADANDLEGLTSGRYVTDEQGMFEVNALPRGARYGAHVWSRDGVRATGVVEARGPDAEHDILQATAPFRLNVVVRARSDGRHLPDTRIFVVDNGLNRLAGVARGQSLMQPIRESVTDAQGFTTVMAEPGAWLLVGHPDHEAATRQVTESLASLDPVEITLDHPDDGILRVTTTEGWPVAGARVTASVSRLSNRRFGGESLGEAVTDDKGEVDLARFGSLSSMEGTLMLHATHETYGRGGLSLDVKSLQKGVPGPGKDIVLRQPGALQLDFATGGWNTPRSGPVNPRHGRVDRDEQASKEHILKACLHYLGTPAWRMEFSSQDETVEALDIDGWANRLPQVRFDDLEPGYYAVAIEGEARSVLFTTPALRVFPGETTFHWVEPPDPARHGHVTLYVPPERFEESSGVATMFRPSASVLQRSKGAHPGLWSPEVGLGDRRMKFDLSGRVTFELVPPGSYAVGLMLTDEGGEKRWHQTGSFEVGPGDDLFLEEVTPQVPPFLVNLN